MFKTFDTKFVFIEINNHPVHINMLYHINYLLVNGLPHYTHNIKYRYCL